MTSGPIPSTIEELRALLDAARETLLSSLTGLTESDFAADLGGVTVTALLAVLARDEHDAIREARAVAGLPVRAAIEEGGATARPLPPQVMHALAGTRYEARVLLAELTTLQTPPPLVAARLLLDGVASREHEAARRIEGRPRGS